MKLKEIEELAGHRNLSPWIVKLMGDAVAKEREACAKVFDDLAEKATSVKDLVYLSQTAAAIRARGEQ